MLLKAAMSRLGACLLVTTTIRTETVAAFSTSTTTRMMITPASSPSLSASCRVSRPTRQWYFPLMRLHQSSTKMGDDNDGTNKEKSTTTTPSSSPPRYQLLEERLALRGPVDSGYGRGGKKLGFPTANLPSSLFQNALADVTNGVYFGWAVIEDDDNDDATNSKKGRNIPHKAVVNVGLSPTFEGAENKEKIVEAHLILEKDDQESIMDPADFYGETMRLQLDAFMRNEMKFPSFPELLAQITADVEDSKAALDLEPFASFRKSDFLSKLDSAWIGGGGGDARASWEKSPQQK